MHPTKENATQLLGALGFRGLDLYLAELIPAVEMAWADGTIQPNERAMLEAYCHALVERLNQEAGAPFFTLTRARALLDKLLERRLEPAERHAALFALKTWGGPGLRGDELRARMLSWASAVASVDGHPAWDTRELFWLQAMKRNLDMAA